MVHLIQRYASCGGEAAQMFPRPRSRGSRDAGGRQGLRPPTSVILRFGCRFARLVVEQNRALRWRSAMPGKKKSGSSIKKPKTYEALKEKGMSKQRAARISNAQANKEDK